MLTLKPKIYHFHSSEERALKTRKIIIYATLLVALVIGVVIWQNTLRTIQKNSRSQIAEREEIFQNTLKTALEQSQKTAFDFVILGRKMLEKNNHDLALVYFERATEIDQKYRDAYFYLGYSYLKTEELKNKETKELFDEKTIELFDNAKEAFIKARDLDPLYGPTYEFLAYTYNKLGDENNAQVCYNKYGELGN